MLGTLIGGRYRIIAPVGEGGMATIWRAVDEQLDREVALKILRPQFGSDLGFAARFKAEARSAAALNHPNIVPVYDYGTEGDTQFIVMQLVDGSDLATHLRDSGPMSATDAARLAREIASALAMAHRRGIVHRDVKPGNILITDAGEVKVADFGIARAMSEASMTVTGTTLGSVHYFSPEQARGDEVTGASDVYSLGIVLYEMLTGRRPFEGDSAAGVALKRLTDDPVPPSAWRAVPPGLEAIVMRSLQRDPADRYPDATALAEALRAWQVDPNALPAAAAAAAAMPVGEPTMYVPPRVADDRTPARAAAPRYAPEPRYEAEPEGRGTPWWTWLLLVLGIVLLGAMGFLGAQLIGSLGPGTSGSPSPTALEQVTIPDWVGDPIVAVREEADRLGLVLDEQTEASGDVDDGDVISTDPVAGQAVERGDSVTVLVSGGAEQVRVPGMIGQTRDEARQTLERERLALGNVSEEPSGATAGTVIRTTPTAGTDVDAGSAVELVLSLGPTPSPTPSPTPEPTPTPTPEPTPPPVETPAPTATP
ncbi:MAG: Stk1 family PASTA domain-containing Ser/Thr kinase [Chloroflexota bacterium]